MAATEYSEATLPEHESKDAEWGFKQWNPRLKFRKLLTHCIAIVAEYDAQLPLTVRQITYLLDARGVIDKTEQGAYKDVVKTLRRARRAGYISFDAIRDDGHTLVESPSYDDADAFGTTVTNMAVEYRRRRQDGQSTYTIVLVESAGMVKQISRVADPYGVPVVGCGGYPSVSAKYDLARPYRWALSAVERRPWRFLHIGDLDPSGESIFDNYRDDITQFIRQHNTRRADTLRDHGLEPAELPLFGKVAVTQTLADELDLPFKDAGDGSRAYQAEAIEPDVMADLVDDAITDPDYWDDAVYEGVKAQEADDREALRADLDRIGWSHDEEGE